MCKIELTGLFTRLQSYFHLNSRHKFDKTCDFSCRNVAFRISFRTLAVFNMNTATENGIAAEFEFDFTIIIFTLRNIMAISLFSFGNIHIKSYTYTRTHTHTIYVYLNQTFK